MASKKVQKHIKKFAKKNPTAFVIFLLILIFVAAGLFIVDYYNIYDLGIVDSEIKDDEKDNDDIIVSGELTVAFLETGNKYTGDAIYIKAGDTDLLIDAGSRNSSSTTISNYINNYVNDNVLEYVIATHPHDDHIGSLPQVMDDFTVGKIIMPELAEFNTPTTRVYERLIDYIVDNNIDAYAAEFGDVYEMDDVKIQILGPVKQVKDLNDMSVICKVYASESTFMLLGDAEKEELASVYEYNNKYGADLKSDVILLGHHGSSTSIYKPFLNKVDAKTAVISCGRNNSYNHPHKEALDYCKQNGIAVVRTDIHGTITYRSTEDSFERIDG